MSTSDFTERTQQRIEDYLAALEQAVESTSDMAAEQVPLLASEYLDWVFWRDSFTSVALGVAALVCFAVALRYERNIRRDERVRLQEEGYWRKRKDGEIMPQCMFSVIGAIALVVSACSCLSVLKVMIAPRVVLLEQIQELISKNL